MNSSEEKVGEFSYVRHAPRLPALREGADAAHCAVAIVGGGPVGLALALGLAAHGVSSVVLESDDTVCIGSRAACISRRSLEIIDRLGALPSFLGKGLAWTGGRSFFKTREVFRFEMPHDSLQRLPPMINLQQYYIEQYLVDAVDRHNQEVSSVPVDLRWASEVTSISPHEDAVDIEVHTSLGNYTIRADWLVACDGGQSPVRRALDLPLVGTAYEGRYVIIDIHLPSSHPTERRAWFDPPWNPGSTVLMHRQVDDIWRIDYQLRAGDDTATALQPANVQRFVQKHLEAIGEGHLPWRTIWTSVYRAGAMTLENYRHGRVLFAGNAAHALPIFGVRGLNSGFDDADNLAWKLALVVQGKAGPAASGQLFAGAGRGLPCQCSQCDAQHGVHVTSFARLRTPARSGIVPGGGTSGYREPGEPSPDGSSGLPGFTAVDARCQDAARSCPGNADAGLSAAGSRRPPHATPWAVLHAARVQPDCGPGRPCAWRHDGRRCHHRGKDAGRSRPAAPVPDAVLHRIGRDGSDQR
jgi:2-polyprenyl-6-methoxyphenol hydroxylase-like FAD-dependent oxidoreductase